MQISHREQEGNVHIFGEKSEVANWIMSHLFLVVGGIFLLLFLLTALAGELVMLRVLMTFPYFFGPVILFRLLFRDLCSRVEIDTETEKIRFFRFYNKNVVEAPMRLVEFRYTWIFTCFYAGKRFAMPGGYINSIAKLLPEGVEIKFSESVCGRLAKKQFSKNRNKGGRIKGTE